MREFEVINACPPDMQENEFLAYRVGGLLYTPAIRKGIADKIEEKAFGDVSSLAFCLEDSIQNDSLSQAEEVLIETLKEIQSREIVSLPLLFVRVRNPQHLESVHEKLGALENLLTGYILPKFDMTCAEEYKKLFLGLNQNREKTLYFMPTLECIAVARTESRIPELIRIKEVLDSVRPYVLNVRVGGNDFCNLFGVRRNVDQCIYDIGVVRSILVDILNVFARDYVVSAPVWEYFGTDEKDAWASGLERELALDFLNGFIGKTVIHPSQIPVVNRSFKVKKADFEDACSVIHWNNDVFAVQSGAGKSRMNEVKCHGNWAKKIYILGTIYGIREEHESLV